MEFVIFWGLNEGLGRRGQFGEQVECGVVVREPPGEGVTVKEGGFFSRGGRCRAWRAQRQRGRVRV